MLAALAAVITSPNLSRLSAMEQLMFFLVKSSDAAPKIDTSLAPAATCQQKARSELISLAREMTSVTMTTVLSFYKKYFFPSSSPNNSVVFSVHSTAKI